jgi:NADH:ubiquinone oxidoreductase subunit 6 (subunit J)
VPIPEACNVWNNPKKVPFIQHLLMAVFWGAVMVLSLTIIMYIGFSKFGIGRWLHEDFGSLSDVAFM